MRVSLIPAQALLAPVLLAGLLLTGAHTVAEAQAPQRPSRNGAICDELAAYGYDPQRQGPGVMVTAAIDHGQAIPACEGATADAPAEPRYRYQLGRAYQAGERFEEARAAYRAAAEAGYAYGYHGLGQMAEYGIGMDADPLAAAAFYEQGIAAGGVTINADLGWLYENGIGFAQDYERAATLYRLAADAGNPLALGELGWLYENGFGVPRDMTEAARFYRQAAELGEAFAMNNLAVFYQNGTGVPRDMGEALRWFEAAAEHRHALAMINLGNLYSDGIEVAQDLARAESYYRRAIVAGDVKLAANAQNGLAWMWAANGMRLYEALQLAELAAATPDVPEYDRAIYRETLAWVLHGLRRDAQAVEHMAAAAEQLGDFAPFRERFGDVYAALGRMDEARAEWQAALDLPDDGLVDRAAVEARIRGE